SGRRSWPHHRERWRARLVAGMVSCIRRRSCRRSRVDLDARGLAAACWQECSMNRLNTAIFIFDGVEVLDFAGPFEVFSRTRLVPGVESRRGAESAPYNVFTVAERMGSIVATGGLSVSPQHDFTGAPGIDVLLIPGGWGTRPLL